jgi:F-type H+-transporting ATPase subunit epsilon
MAGERTTVRCLVVTPETTVLDAEADFVAIPAHDGEVGVLPGRGPLVARLGPGELRLRAAGQALVRLYIDGGFGQVRNNVVTILTPRARQASELDPQQLQGQLKEINATVPTSPEGLTDKAARLRRVRAQLRLARHRS